MSNTGITSAGLGSVTTQTPQEYMNTGVMEIAGQPVLDLTDIKPGIIRLLRRQENNLGSAGSVNRIYTIPRSLDILNAGVRLMPCIHTDGWDSVGTFTSYLGDWIDALNGAPNEPVYWEVGNEPGGVLTNPPSQATIRANYLTYMVAARTVLSARGKKLILSAITGAAGGTQAVLTDISNNVSGSNFSQIDGMAVHSYNWTVTDQGLDSSIYNDTEDSVQGYRNTFNSNSLSGKPIFITETGFSCATRADGAQHGDWGSGVPNQPTGTNAGGRRAVNITLAQQANFLTNTMAVMASHRAKSAWYLRSCIWFAAQDYGLPSGGYDHHCGIVDVAGGKRPSYTALKNAQRQYAIGP